MPSRRVSLCLLTYKRASILPRTLESLLNQTYRDFELLIHDDCSPDETESVCREFERRDTRIRYYRNANNLRYANNQNAAILRASGDYVGILHDGDVYHPPMVERWVDALDAHPSAALVFNAAERMDESGRTVGYYVHPYGDLVSGADMLATMLGTEASPIFGIVMIRRSCVMETGPFDPRLPTLADVDMWMRLMLRHDVAYVSEPLYKIAGREAGHHNTYTNWKVRREFELIHLLNLRRRLASSGDDPGTVGKRLGAMLERERWRQLFACLRHLRVGPFIEGVRFVRKYRHDLEIGPDQVVTWDELRTLIA